MVSFEYNYSGYYGYICFNKMNFIYNFQLGIFYI